MTEPTLHIIDNRASAQESLRSETLHTVERFIRRYIVVSNAQACALVLWIAHTHAIDAAECSPYLHVEGQKRSGKTRCLEVLELLVRNPVRTSDTTEAVLFELLSQRPTTLLLDEIDTVFGGGKSREPLRALLNASYRRGSPVRRMRGRRIEEFEVFSPKIIAGIGGIPDTIADRSIPIRMTRKADHQHVERFHFRDAEEASYRIRDELNTRFGHSFENLDWFRRLAAHRPNLPEWLNDRQADSWEPLLALAEVVGQGWKDRAELASYELHAMERTL